MQQERRGLSGLADSKYLLSILDSMGASFYVIDVYGNYVAMNELATREICGGLNAEVVNKNVWYNCRLAMTQNKRIISEEFSSGKWWFTIKQPLCDENKCVGVMVLGFDITNQKRALDKCIQFAQEKIQLAQEHTNNLQMFTHSLLQGLSGAFGGVKHRVDSLQFGLPLLRDIAIGMKVTKGRRNLLLNMTDTIGLVKKAVDSVSQLCETTKVNLRVAQIQKEQFKLSSIADALYTAIRDYPFGVGENRLLHCDFRNDFYFNGVNVYVIQVFVNLLKNAYAAIKRANKGEIFINFVDGEENTQEPPLWHKVVVRDTALGITPEVMLKLFKPYTEANGGIGLGLAFCKMVMRTFGGEITCDSQLGKYTEFTLWFPVG